MIFLVILGVISLVVGIIRGDMTSSAAMFIGYLVPALLGAVILIVDHVGRRREQDRDRPVRRGARRAEKQKRRKNKKSRCPDGSGFLRSKKGFRRNIPVRRNA